ncbi:MAG: hypothetical protein HY300_09660 [Verrucomicrobia bacterium]|nr:hypothetical protein [Verrucomicrobiota bacterium]
MARISLSASNRYFWCSMNDYLFKLQLKTGTRPQKSGAQPKSSSRRKTDPDPIKKVSGAFVRLKSELTHWLYLWASFLLFIALEFLMIYGLLKAFGAL